jgi:hypothetical protein
VIGFLIAALSLTAFEAIGTCSSHLNQIERLEEEKSEFIAKLDEAKDRAPAPLADAAPRKIASQDRDIDREAIYAGYRLSFTFQYLPGNGQHTECVMTWDGRSGHVTISSVSAAGAKAIVDKQLPAAEAMEFINTMETLGIRALKDCPGNIGFTISDGFHATFVVHSPGMDADGRFSIGPIARDDPPYAWYRALMHEMTRRLKIWSTGDVDLYWDR